MQWQPVQSLIEQGVIAGDLYEAHIGADIASAGTVNLTLKTLSSLLVGKRLRVVAKVSTETGGFVIEMLSGSTVSSGTTVTPLNLNRNGAAWSTSQSFKSNATVSAAGTTVLEQHAGPGEVALPMVELAPDTTYVWRLTNDVGATARGSLSLLLVVV